MTRVKTSSPKFWTVFNQGGTRLSSDGYPEFPDFSSEFPLLRNSSDRIPQPVDDESNDDGGGPIR